MNQKWLALDEISGVEPSVTISEARAGQILAEMLGMVCHPEYIASGNSQTVHPLPFLWVSPSPDLVLSSHLFDGIHLRASWFTSTVSMHQYTSRPSRLLTFPPCATKISTFFRLCPTFICTILVAITFYIHWIERNLFVNSSRSSASWPRGKLISVISGTIVRLSIGL